MATFDKALLALKEGYFVHRSGWNGKGMSIAIQYPDENSKMTAPYIYIEISGFAVDRIPWLASQADLLADDWEFVVE